MPRTKKRSPQQAVNDFLLEKGWHLHAKVSPEDAALLRKHGIRVPVEWVVITEEEYRKLNDG
jgi:hypothetical protein